mmetsp:Transcript_33905/g.54730  ORF Transcript_33905/g.54730 Transcript_33905/m.54730 type:complete len:400 (+) Transcript_33905:27-1226(+)
MLRSVDRPASTMRRATTRSHAMRTGLSVVCFAMSTLSGTDAHKPAVGSQIEGAFFGALVADALTLGTHYEYDAIKIKQYYGNIDKYYAPGEKTGGQTHGVGWGQRNYHGGNGRGPAKVAGEQTDYGDYNILILEHLAAHPNTRIELSTLIPRWQTRLQTWTAWMCSQTKQTNDQVTQGVPLDQIGGGSNAMAIRHAAAYAVFDSEEDIVHASKAAMFTHRDSSAQQGGEFFARVTFRIIHKGLSSREAIEQVSKESSSFIQTKVKQAMDKVEEALDPNRPLIKEEYADDLALTSMARLWDVGKTEPIKVGKASPTEGTLPGSIYFILKYQGDMASAMKANAMVGGDNASRSIAIGMVMGAEQGVEGIPKELGQGHLVEWDRCLKLLRSLPLLQGKNAEL